MAKARSIKVVRLAGDQRSKVRGSWSPPSGNVTRRYPDKKGGKYVDHTHSKKWCVEKYEYRWRYRIGVIKKDGKGFAAEVMYTDWQTTELTTVDFSVPEGATSVYLYVRPVSKEYSYYSSSKSKSKTTKKWISSDTAHSEVCNTGAFHNPERPSIQSAALGSDGLAVIVKCQSSDPYAEAFEVRIEGGGRALAGKASLKTDSWTYAKSGTVAVKGAPGTSYAVSARIWNVFDEESAWVAFPDPVLTKPPQAARPSAAALTDGTCTVSWPAVATAEGYEIAYGDDQRAMAATGDYKTKTGIAGTAYTFRDLDPGKTWYFWVRAVSEAGEGAWSADCASCTLGKAPDAPTVLADEYVAILGEAVRVRWIHNSSDESPQHKARVTYRKGSSGAWQSATIQGPGDTFEIPTAGVPDGQYVSFYVNTWGLNTSAEFMSPDSETRMVRVWERPSMTAAVPEQVTEFPFSMAFDPSATNQSPVLVSVAVSAKEAHEVTEADGETRRVAAGAAMWKGDYMNPPDPLSVELSAGDIDLADGQTYLVAAECVMSSGLTCRAEGEFSCSFEAAPYVVQADLEAWGEWGCEVTPAAIVPPQIDPSLPEPAEGWVTPTVLAEGVTLAIYRRDGYGGLTPLMRNIPNDGTWSLIDDHASRGRWRYRVVAIDERTGRVSWADVAEASDGDTGGIVIMWGQGNAVRRRIDGDDVDELDPAGTVLALPWDVTPTESAEPDVEYVGYDGREDPTSYWGTQLGRSAKWTTVIPRTDTDSLDKLRELAVLRGEVYAREPLGNGYWCGVRVDMTAPKHSGLVEVTLDVTPTSTRDECIVVTAPPIARLDGEEAAP